MADRAVKDAVLTFLGSRNAIPGLTEKEQLACEYLDIGIIDSVGIVEMIVFLESEFDVRFSPVDMQSVEFRTIGGLVGLTERLRKERASQ